MVLILQIDGVEWHSPPFGMEGAPRVLRWREGPNVKLHRRLSCKSKVAARVIDAPPDTDFHLKNPFYGGEKYELYSAKDDSGRICADKYGRIVELFHGLIGGYWLELEIGCGKRGNPRLRFPVEIETPLDRLQIINQMIDEILMFDHLPFQLLAQKHLNIWGRIQMFYAAQRHNVGEVVQWSQYEALLKLVKKLKPILAMICADAATSLGRTMRYKKIEDVHRFDRKVLTQLRRKGILDICASRNKRHKVWAEDPSPVFDLPANCVIKTFLRQCRDESCTLIAAIDKELAEQPSKGRRKVLEDQRKVIDLSVKAFFEMQLRNGFVWSGCSVKILLSQADPIWFDRSDAYRRVYAIMEEYIRVDKKRCKMIGKNQGVDYRRVPFGEPSILQRKYDEIYESWCYLRIIKAFINNGFEQVEDNYFNVVTTDSHLKTPFLPRVEANRPVVATRGPIKVFIYYGVRARADRDSVFWLPHKSESTPDYLLIFSSSLTTKKYAVIMDAKAMSELGESEIIKRGNYLQEFNINKYEDTQKIRRPRQSWLFYWGDKTEALSVDNAIEYEYIQGENGADNTLKINEGQRFPRCGHDEDIGLCDLEEQHAGHIKITPQTTELGDPFVWWVRVQSAIAERYLGILEGDNE